MIYLIGSERVNKSPSIAIEIHIYLCDRQHVKIRFEQFITVCRRHLASCSRPFIGKKKKTEATEENTHDSERVGSQS